MKKLISNIITYSVKNKYLIVVLTVVVAIVGVWAFKTTSVDAFPDVTNTKVTIITQWQGRSAQEIEKFVTIPIEVAMNAAQQKTDIRSTTLFGLSVVTVVFDDRVNDDFARQQVFNLLADADIPEDVSPEVQPLYGPTGEIFRYTLSSGNKSVRELKTLQDWVIERRLREVEGVADIVSFGGEVKTFEVSVNPNELLHYGITSLELYDALANSNLNVGGDVIEKNNQNYVVRGIGLLNNIEEIGDIVVKNIDGVPILVRNLAQVREFHQPKLGQVERNADNDVVEGIVVMRKGGNTEKTLASLKEKLKEIKENDLPDDVNISAFYDRSDLVTTATHTVLKNLLEGILLVTLVVFIFMVDWRCTVIVALVIPLALLFAFICLKIAGMSANLLSMGAIDFGIIIDGAVVMVESLYVYLAKQSLQIGQFKFDNRVKGSMIRRTATDKATSVVFAKLIIITALIPVFSFQKVEGKMFSPLAFTLGFALLGALIFTLTLVPALSSLLLRKNVREKSNFFLKNINNAAVKGFSFVQNRAKTAVIVAFAVMFCGIGAYFLLGSEFLPQMNEGSIYIRATMPQSISLNASVKFADEFRSIINSFDEVEECLTQAGRPNDGTDATGFYNIELFVKLKNKKDWKRKISKEDLTDEISKALNKYQGVDFNFSQPISDNVEEAVSGVKGSIVAKVFSNDIYVSEDAAAKIVNVMKDIKGIEDLGVIHNVGQQELQINIKEDALARYGVEKADMQAIIEMAIGGKTATKVYEDEKKFDLVVRYGEDFRSNKEEIAKILVPSSTGAMIPVSELADISTITGPLMICRDNHKRYTAVKFSVRGRDMVSAVNESINKVDKEIKQDKNLRITWTGDFENQKRASKRLLEVIPISILLIFLLLYSLFSDIEDSLLVLLNVPFAATGGILMLLITGFNFSISAGIGFIALFGICIQNGVIMLSEIKQYLKKNKDLHQSVTKAMQSRIRSVLMTAMMATLGLLPAALSTGIGSESQRPLAIVIIGGLITATLFTLFIFPLIVEMRYKRKQR